MPDSNQSPRSDASGQRPANAPPETLSDLADTARREVADAKERLSVAATQVQDAAREAGQTFQDMASSEIDRHLADFGRNAARLTQGLRDASGDLQGTGAVVLTQLIDVIDDAVMALDREPARRLSGQMGRDHPGVFLMGCLAAGLVVGRLITAADPEEVS